MSTKSYDLKLVTISFLGVVLNEGLNDGDFITIKRKGPFTVTKTGADGEKVVIKSYDKGADIEISLLPTSLSNNFLSQAIALARATPGSVGAGPLQVSDRNNGAVLGHAEHAWIVQEPDIARGKELGTNTWKLEAGDTDMDLSGYPSLV